LRKSRIQPAGITDASAAKMRTLAACLLAHGRIKASEARMLVDVTSS
jgi:hypothetical protein